MAEAESTNTMFQNSFAKNGDGDFALKVIATTGSGGSSVVSVQPVTAARVNSTVANGKAAAPGAGTAICTTAALAVGTWDIEATAFITGTTVANVELDNIELRLGGVKFTTVIVPVNGVSGATANGSIRCRIQVGVSAALSLNALVAATASSIYAGQITATRVM